LPRKIVAAFRESLADYQKDPMRHIAIYAALTGLNSRALMQVFKEYSYPANLDLQIIENQFEKAGATFPLPSSIAENIFVP